MTALCSEVWFGWTEMVTSYFFFRIKFCVNCPLAFKVVEEKFHISSILSDLSLCRCPFPLRIACKLNVGRETLSVLLCCKNVKDFVIFYLYSVDNSCYNALSRVNDLKIHSKKFYRTLECK